MNVAVFLPGWIGDAVMATPTLRVLRIHFHDGHIVAVAKPQVADLLDGGGWFDEVLLDRGGPGIGDLASVAWRLRKRAIDIAVLLPNSFRSALAAWLGGCRQRIGYARYGRSFLLTDALPPVQDEDGRRVPSPILDAYNQLAELAGCHAPPRRMELFTTANDETEAERVWQSAGMTAHAEVICLNPGAALARQSNGPSSTSQHWPETWRPAAAAACWCCAAPASAA